jgi:lipid-A-disaccharide synthase-like uncharacterized protein
MFNLNNPQLTAEQIWLGIGFFGQAMFFGRFFVQWLASEKAKKSVIPNTFWYFSIIGGLIVLAYSIYRKDPVFIAGQSMGVLIYLRNLYFIHRKQPT